MTSIKNPHVRTTYEEARDRVRVLEYLVYGRTDDFNRAKNLLDEAQQALNGARCKARVLQLRDNVINKESK